MSTFSDDLLLERLPALSLRSCFELRLLRRCRGSSSCHRPSTRAIRRHCHSRAACRRAGWGRGRSRPSAVRHPVDCRTLLRCGAGSKAGPPPILVSCSSSESRPRFRPSNRRQNSSSSSSSSAGGHRTGPRRQTHPPPLFLLLIIPSASSSSLTNPAFLLLALLIPPYPPSSAHVLLLLLPSSPLQPLPLTCSRCNCVCCCTDFLTYSWNSTAPSLHPSRS